MAAEIPEPWAEELKFLRAEEERLQDLVDDYHDRNQRITDRLEKLRDLVGMAQQAAARTRGGAGSAVVSVEEVLYILDGKDDA